MEEREVKHKPKIEGLVNDTGKNKKTLRDGPPLSGHLLSRRLGVIAIPVFIAIIAALAILDIKAVFEPFLLLPVLNTLFVSVVSFAVAYISARCYLTMGLPNILLLGCGVLMFGTGNLIAGWLITSPGSPNINVIIHNIGALFGSLFHAVGAMLPLPEITAGKVSKRRKFQVILVYFGVLVFMALVTIASFREAIPPFFIQGVGPTPLRQGVLGVAVTLFAISSFLFMQRYSKLKVDFLYWYSLALVLIAVGLSAVFLQTAVGSPIGWAGRSAQYLGGIYFFIAVLTVARGARAKGITLELALSNFFREAEKHYRALVETVSDAIVSVNHDSRVLLWNPTAEKMFGYSRGEAVGSLLIDLIVPDHYAENLSKDFAKGENNPLIGEITEIEARKKDGETFPVELSISSRKTVDGWISTIIIRDIIARKQMEKKQLLRFEILKTFHQYGLLKNMCERAVALIKEYLGCEVVALRLKEGGDYPYFINNGFPKEFIESENCLCVHDEKGDCLMNSRGSCLLACMCGIVINAEYNQDKPFFTKNGSFWTNSTTELLASTTEEDRGTTTRNVCSEYGYESVALIPIKSGSYNIGLLQINDKRRKLFTSDNLEFLEELGHILGIVVERNRAEEEIKNLAKFPSENPYPVLRIAKDGTVLYANEAAIPLLNEWGCRVGQSVPKQWQYLIRNTIDTDRRKSIELEYKGKIFSLAVIPVVAAEYVILYGLDITERKMAEEALKRSEERYALAQRAANIGSWDWDIRTGNLKWSEKIEPMFGFGRGEFGATYEAFLECIHPEDRQHVVDSVNACIEKGKDYDIEHRIVWPNGKVRWVSETGNVIRDKNNKAIRMLGVVRDITERKLAEEVLKRDKETFERLVSKRTHELFKTKAELDKAKRLSDLGTLAATVAHELRNPLGVIKTASYNIRKKRENLLLDKHLDNIEKKISESDQIINNLLGYSRIKIPRYERIQIYDILNECITSTKKRFYRENVSIVKNFKSTKKKFIEADPLQIREIFNNILTNAYQSISNKKGKIEIEARVDGKGSIKISFKDNGVGIDKEDLQRILEPFFTRKSKGTGLGLTICNELVNLHGGKIEIESKKGKGTTVTVSLPIKRQIR